MGWADKSRTAVTYGVAVTVVFVVAAVLVGQLFGVPVLVSYVETGSMSPTLEAGDGYVAVPAELTGSVEEGDVITFESQRLHGGGLTTHRVVEVTEEGYVTKGDANPFTDQDGSEPLVTDGQVRAEALQVDDAVVALPHLGTASMALSSAVEWVQYRLASLLGTSAVLGTQGLAYLAFAVGVALLLAGAIGDRNRRTDRSRARERTRPNVYDGRTVLVALAACLVVVTAGTMVAASGTNESGVVSAEFDSDRPDVVPTGETTERTYALSNGGVLPMVAVLEPASAGVAVDDPVHRLEAGDRANVTVEVSAPPETGYYLRGVEERRYFALLPTSTIVSLHELHPWIATAALTAVVVFPIVGVFLLAVGAGSVRTRTRTRESKGDWL